MGGLLAAEQVDGGGGHGEDRKGGPGSGQPLPDAAGVARQAQVERLDRRGCPVWQVDGPGQDDGPGVERGVLAGLVLVDVGARLGLASYEVAAGGMEQEHVDDDSPQPVHEHRDLQPHKPEAGVVEGGRVEIPGRAQPDKGVDWLEAVLHRGSQRFAR